VNTALKKIWPGLALALCLIAGPVPGAGTETVQTLPPVAKPFAAPDFTLKGEDGKIYRLSDYRGKVVVLNFWATWCPPCRYEMPSMERAWRKVKGGNIAILAVNVGENGDTVFAFTGRFRCRSTATGASSGNIRWSVCRPPSSSTRKDRSPTAPSAAASGTTTGSSISCVPWSGPEPPADQTAPLRRTLPSSRFPRSRRPKIARWVSK
jgi:thiol-disulfide isomerase/thioredoxin